MYNICYLLCFSFVRKTGIHLYQQLLVCQPEVNDFHGEGEGRKYWILFFKVFFVLHIVNFVLQFL